MAKRTEALPENERIRVIGRFGLKLGLRLLGGRALDEQDRRGDFFCPKLKAMIEAKMSSTRTPPQLRESQFLSHYETALESGERRLYFIVRYSNSTSRGKKMGKEIRISPLKEQARTATEIEAYLWENLREIYLVDTLAIYRVMKVRPKLFRTTAGRGTVSELKFRVNVGDLKGLTSGDLGTFLHFGLSLAHFEWDTKTVRLRMEGRNRRLTLHTLLARPEVLEAEEADVSFDPAELEAAGTDGFLPVSPP